MAEPLKVDIFANFTERDDSDDDVVQSAPSEEGTSRQGVVHASTPSQRSGCEESENEGTAAVHCAPQPGSDEKQGDAETEEDDPLETSLQGMLQARCFAGFDGKTTTFLYTTQLTHSNVVSTVVTSRPFNLKRRQSSLLSINNNNSSSDSGGDAGKPGEPGLERKKVVGGSRNQDMHASHVYGQPCNPKKVRNQQKGKYQAQLPAFRRSLPSLPIPVNRLNQELVQERDKFMAQLHKEREEKAFLENWAATKIQACYRGYRSRPRIVTYQVRQQLNSLRAIRLDLSDMHESLKKAGESSVARDPGSQQQQQQQISPWRKDVGERAGKKQDARTRKERVYSAATLIQACVKRFLARFAFAHLIARHYDEVRLKSVVRVQSIYRGFHLRNCIHRVVAKLQQQAVLQIQSLIRGIQARERVCILRFEQKSERRRIAGEPLQFTLPSRTRPMAATSSLRPLYEHRKTRAKLEFKTVKWREEQMYLRIHKVAVKLCINRSILHRRLLAEALSTPKRRKPRASSAQRSARFDDKLRQNSSNASSTRVLKSRSPSRRRELVGTSSSLSGSVRVETPPSTPSSPSKRNSSGSRPASTRALTPSSPSSQESPEAVW